MHYQGLCYTWEQKVFLSKPQVLTMLVILTGILSIQATNGQPSKNKTQQLLEKKRTAEEAGMCIP